MCSCGMNTFSPLVVDAVCLFFLCRWTSKKPQTVSIARVGFCVKYVQFFMKIQRGQDIKEGIFCMQMISWLCPIYSMQNDTLSFSSLHKFFVCACVCVCTCVITGYVCELMKSISAHLFRFFSSNSTQLMIIGQKKKLRWLEHTNLWNKITTST